MNADNKPTLSMNDETKARLAVDQRDEAHEAFNSALAAIMNERAMVEQQLLDLADEIRRRTERVTKQVHEGLQVNRLGELQAMGSEFDRLCGEREMLAKHQIMHETLADRAGIDDNTGETNFARNRIAKIQGEGRDEG